MPDRVGTDVERGQWNEDKEEAPREGADPLPNEEQGRLGREIVSQRILRCDANRLRIRALTLRTTLDRRAMKGCRVSARWALNQQGHWAVPVWGERWRTIWERSTCCRSASQSPSVREACPWRPTTDAQTTRMLSLRGFARHHLRDQRMLMHLDTVRDGFSARSLSMSS